MLKTTLKALIYFKTFRVSLVLVSIPVSQTLQPSLPPVHVKKQDLKTINFDQEQKATLEIKC